jgi:hypothetical protein
MGERWGRARVGRELRGSVFIEEREEEERAAGGERGGRGLHGHQWRRQVLHDASMEGESNGEDKHTQ